MGMDESGAIRATLARAGFVLAPGLFVSEVSNALWSYAEAGSIDRDTALTRQQEAFHLVDDLIPDSGLAVEALAESIRLRHPTYDLLYAVLARRTGAALLTRDRKLGSLADSLGVERDPDR